MWRSKRPRDVNGNPQKEDSAVGNGLAESSESFGFEGSGGAMLLLAASQRAKVQQQQHQQHDKQTFNTSILDDEDEEENQAGATPTKPSLMGSATKKYSTSRTRSSATPQRVSQRSRLVVAGVGAMGGSADKRAAAHLMQFGASQYRGDQNVDEDSSASQGTVDFTDMIEATMAKEKEKVPVSQASARVEVNLVDNDDEDDDDLFHPVTGAPVSTAYSAVASAFPWDAFASNQKAINAAPQAPSQRKVGNSSRGASCSAGHQSTPSQRRDEIFCILDEEEDEDAADLALLCAIPSQGRARRGAAAKTDPKKKSPAASRKKAAPVVDFKYDFNWDSSGCLAVKVIPAFQLECSRQLLGDYETLSAFRPFVYHKSMTKLQASAGQVFKQTPFPDAPTTLPSPQELSGDPNMTFTLRDYQVAGVQYLLNHFHKGLPCILGDDMGLGKTVQLSYFLGSLHHLYGIQGPHLVVAPLSTMSGWSRELARWAPKLKVVKLHGKPEARSRIRRRCRRSPHVVITTYATMINEDKFMKAQSWVVHMVDEAHTLKSDGTRLSTISHKMHSVFRVAITGTPIHNGAIELWNIMSFLYPFLCKGAKRSGKDFDEIGRDKADTERLLGADNTGIASKLLDIVMLRRLKTVVEKSLPPKTEVPAVLLKQSLIQKAMLDTWRTKVQTSSGVGELRSLFHDGRKIANHPYTVKLLADEDRGIITDYDAEGNSPGIQRLMQSKIAISPEHLIAPSAKMVQLDKLCKELRAQNHRALIFSNYTSQLDLLEGFCKLNSYNYERLDGSSSRICREVSMRRFNPAHSEMFLFLITTTAGGVGITLTGADTVILYDCHYNPQMDRQAMDRAHRIGQTRPVSVYRFCVEGTIEEQVHRHAESKAILGDFIVDKKLQVEEEEGSDGDTDEVPPTAAAATEFDEKKFFSAANMKAMFTENGTFTNSGGGGGGVEDDDVPPPDSDEMKEARKIAEDLWQAKTDYLEAREAKKGTWTTGKSGQNSAGVGRKFPNQTLCFYCDEPISAKHRDPTRRLKPGGLGSCNSCPKEYHADCIEEVLGEMPRRNSMWVCPRHECSDCGRDPASDGGMFYCACCMTAYCIDCLDTDLFALNPMNGTHFLHVSKEYLGLEADGMRIKKGVYYILCEDCQGGGEDGDEEEEDEGDDDTGSEQPGDGPGTPMRRSKKAGVTPIKRGLDYSAADRSASKLTDIKGGGASDNTFMLPSGSLTVLGVGNKNPTKGKAPVVKKAGANVVSVVHNLIDDSSDDEVVEIEKGS